MYKEKYIPYPEIAKMVEESMNNQTLKILIIALLQKKANSKHIYLNNYNSSHQQWVVATILNQLSNKKLLNQLNEIYFYYLLSKK